MPTVHWSQPQYVLCSHQDAGTIQVAEVVSAIANAVVSKIYSWWGGSSDATPQTTQRQPQRVENTLGLSMRWVGAHKCVGGAQCIIIVCGMLSGACSL